MLDLPSCSTPDHQSKRRSDSAPGPVAIGTRTDLVPSWSVAAGLLASVNLGNKSTEIPLEIIRLKLKADAGGLECIAYG